MAHGGGRSGGLGGHHMREAAEEELGRPYDHRVMTRLLTYLAPYKRSVALALLATMVYTAASSAQPYFAKLAIDNYIRRGDMRGLSLLGGIFLLVALVAWGVQYLQQRVTARIGHRILYTLRTQLFAHLQRLPIKFYDRHETGSVMSRVQNDVGVLQDFVTGSLLTILADFLSLGMVVFFLLYQDVTLALITLTVVPLLAATMALWQQRARRTFFRVRQAIAVVTASLQENVSGVRAIQSLTREDENLKRFDRVNADHLEANVEAGKVSAAVMPVVEVLVATATALVILFGGRRVLAGDLGPGVVVSFALYIQRFFDPIRDLVVQYTQLQRTMVGGQRIFEVLDTPPQEEDPHGLEPADLRGEVTFQGAHFSYIPGLEVLHDVELHVPAGQTVALVGPTGAGKSTVASLLARFYDVNQGCILIDGIDIRRLRRSFLARRVAMVPQDPFLFSATVRENIRYGRSEAGDEEVEAAARVVGAHDFVLHLPQGYDTFLAERGQNLSQGQRQLIAFARAVLADPHILILDEATANVDPATEALIQRALSRLLSGRTAFVIAHRLSTVQRADRIVVLDQGRIVEEGRHEDLLGREGLYAHLYRLSYQGLGGDGHHPQPGELSTPA